MEYPRCHLYFLRTHTLFKLIVHIFEENTITGDLWVISCFKGDLKAKISNFSNIFFAKSNISEVNFVKLFSLVYCLLRENYVRSWIFPAFATFLIYGPCALCLGHK